MPDTHTSSHPTPSITPILAINFVGTLGFSIVLPFLVFLVARLGGNALIYGVMGATYSIFQLIGAPILGRWSDRYGRRRILLLSQLGTLASWAIFLTALFLPAITMVEVDSPVLGAFTLTVPLLILFLARALDGLTGGNVSVANAYLADVTPEQERSTNFGKMALSSNLGFIVGPALAGVLGATALGEIPPVVAALLISAMASVLIVRLPDSSPCTLERNPERSAVHHMMGQEQKECIELHPTTSLSVGEVLRLPGVAFLLALYFLVFLGFNFFYITFPVWAISGLEWTLPQIGVFFSVMGLSMALVQGPVLQRASRVLSDRTLVIGGSALLAVSFLFFTSRSLYAIYSGTLALAIGNGVMWPSLMAVLSRSSDSATQGSVQGVASSVGAFASIIGLIVGGFLFGFLGSNVFLISTVLITFVFLVSFRIPKG